MNGESILPLAVEGLGFCAAGRNLVGPLDFRLDAGGISVVLGPNGAGKTLTLRMCHGITTPSAGRVRWLGGAARPALRQAMVFQDPVLLRRSARANLAHALACRGVPRSARGARIDAALARTGLAHLARMPARVLSGGERQRLALARAWALEPEVLFLDEPTASLDPAASRAVEEVIATIHRAGTKVVMTTHDLSQAKRLADEVLFLCEGCLLERAPAADFFAHPTTPEARAFLTGEIVISRERSA